VTRPIKYHEEARIDIYRLNDYIEHTCKAPLTAKRYLSGLESRILWLQDNAELRPIEQELSSRINLPIRRLNYEKMAILYTIENEEVLILRIVPQSMIY